MTEFQKMSIDLSQILDTNASRRLPDPPGFSASVAKEAEASASVRVNKPTATDLAGVAKRQQALFSLATSPVKNAAMMAFMMYMAGTQLHFFSILTTFNGIYSPLSAILKSNLVFQPDPEGKLNITGPRLLYCLIHGASLCWAVYRVHLMGLLPTHLSDWVAAVKMPPVTSTATTGLLRRPWQG